MRKKFVNLSQVETEIRDGDLLLFRGSGFISRLIRTAGRTRYTHAAKAVWWRDVLFCCETRELRGGRAVTLASQVRRYPSAIDVFETNPANRWRDYNRQAAARFMLQLAGCDYGYANVLRAALLHLPVVRLVARPSLDDEHISRFPPFCSAACAMADRLGGGVDPVPLLADRFTEPGDLARSPFYRYRFTLRGE